MVDVKRSSHVTSLPALVNKECERKYSYSRKDLGNPVDASYEARYRATTKAHASVTCHLGIWAGEEVLCFGPQSWS
ncbi:hypothetical protein Tco_1242497 [Tanacetum coccineum]